MVLLFFLFFLLWLLPTASYRALRAKCPLNLIQDGHKAVNYHRPGSYIISGIVSPKIGFFEPFVFSKPPQLKLYR